MVYGYSKICFWLFFKVWNRQPCVNIKWFAPYNHFISGNWESPSYCTSLRNCSRNYATVQFTDIPRLSPSYLSFPSVFFRFCHYVISPSLSCLCPSSLSSLFSPVLILSSIRSPSFLFPFVLFPSFLCLSPSFPLPVPHPPWLWIEPLPPRVWTIFSLHDFIVCLVPLTPFHPHLLWKGYDAGDNIPHASHEAVNFWYFYVKRKFVSFDINLKNGAYSLSLYDDWIGPDHERRGSLLPPTPLA